MIGRLNPAKPIDREEDIRKPRFDDDRKVESRFASPVYLALEPLPSVADSAEKIIERLAFDGKSAVSGDAVIAGADSAAMHPYPRRIEVPRRLLAGVYRDIKHKLMRGAGLTLPRQGG